MDKVHGDSVLATHRVVSRGDTTLKGNTGDVPSPKSLVMRKSRPFIDGTDWPANASVAFFAIFDNALNIVAVKHESIQFLEFNQLFHVHFTIFNNNYYTPQGTNDLIDLALKDIETG